MFYNLEPDQSSLGAEQSTWFRLCMQIGKTVIRQGKCEG